MLVNGIHHVAVIVKNVDHAKEFYTQVFGFTPIKRLTESLSKNRGAWFQVGDLELHLQERTSPIEKTEQHFALTTAHLDEIVQRVQKLGGRVQEAKLTERISKRCFVYDLDNNRIELLQA